MCDDVSAHCFYGPLLRLHYEGADLLIIIRLSLPSALLTTYQSVPRTLNVANLLTISNHEFKSANLQLVICVNSLQENCEILPKKAFESLNNYP